MTDPRIVPLNPVSRGTLMKKAKAQAQQPEELPPTRRPFATLRPTKAAVVRVIAAGQKLDPAATVTPTRDNPFVPENQNYERWGSATWFGKTVKDTLASGPTVGDLRNWYERAFIDIDPAPKHVDK